MLPVSAVVVPRVAAIAAATVLVLSRRVFAVTATVHADGASEEVEYAREQNAASGAVDKFMDRLQWTNSDEGRFQHRPSEVADRCACTPWVRCIVGR